MAGNFEVEWEGDREAKAYLETASARTDNELMRIVNDIARFGGERLKAHAPERVHPLVAVDSAQFSAVGTIDAIAGVLPDPDEFGSTRGLGSDPADWPFFVDQGTGIYGEFHRPIRGIPGHPMFWTEGETGNMVGIFANEVRGQPGKHFSDDAFADAVEFTPTRIAEFKLENT